jgi:hypothetical protein
MTNVTRFVAFISFSPSSMQIDDHDELHWQPSRPNTWSPESAPIQIRVGQRLNQHERRERNRSRRARQAGEEAWKEHARNAFRKQDIT